MGRNGQRDTAAGDDPIRHRRPGRIDGVFRPAFALLRRSFAYGADAEVGDPGRQAGYALFQLPALVMLFLVRQGITQLTGALVHRRLSAGAAQDRGVVRTHRGPFAEPQRVIAEVLGQNSELPTAGSAPGEDRNIRRHGMAVDAATRALGRGAPDLTLAMVREQYGQRLVCYVLGKDEQGALVPGGPFEGREDFLGRRDSVFAEEQVGLVQLDLGLPRTKEITRDQAMIELHA